MLKIRTLAFTAITLITATTAAYSYNFWGVNADLDNYQGSPQLTFSNVSSSNVDYVVGGYEFTRVDGVWYGPFVAASPGEGYTLHRKCDAEGIFFRPSNDAAEFTIFTGMPQTGITAPECGYGNRQFGPGDLKIDVNDKSYGVGLRLSNLTWATDPNTTAPWYQIHNAMGGVENIFSRDKGTLGTVELNPTWCHVDHHELQPGSDASFAFYKSGSGNAVGQANVIFTDTGLNLDGAAIYAYQVSVPWTVLGINSADYSFTASWRPDCGNDLIMGSFTGNTVPEPAGFLAITAGLLGFVISKKRQKSK